MTMIMNMMIIIMEVYKMMMRMIINIQLNYLSLIHLPRRMCHNLLEES